MQKTCALLVMVAALAISALPAAAQDRGPAGTVTLSRTDYDRLLDLASRQPRPPDGAPLPAALTRTDIRARVNGGNVRATMIVEGEVFHTGAVKVPLISNATLLDARTADRPLPLVAEGNAHVAVVTGPATFSATLDWGSAITTAPGRGSFVLPVPPAGSATATFDVPGEQSDLRVSPGLVLRRTSAGRRTLIEAALDPGSATQVWWSARETNQTNVPRDVRMLADVKTLITIGDADLRLLSLVDLTIVQGEPAQFDVQLPAGYELAGVTGVSLDRSEQQGNRVTLFVSSPSRRRHQFLLNLERSVSGSFTLQTAFPTVAAAQRETGEVAIEGIGTLEVSSPADVPGLRRMDVREVDPAISAAARQPLVSAYRYQRGASGVPTLSAAVTRFPDAAVLAAVADRAIATTLLTSQGRALTEIALVLRNRAQPFMRVVLPPGATMLSVDVAGAAAKPVEGTDGMRIPLLRPGFRPDGPYKVSFVYLHAGAAFAKKGDMQMTLPRMDVPVSVVEWELFVPDQYRADRFTGSAIGADLIGLTMPDLAGSIVMDGAASEPLAAGQIAGRLTDAAGGVLPRATVIAEVGGRRLTAVSDASGRYALSGVPSGTLVIKGQLPGFKTAQRSIAYDERPRQIDFQLAVGGVSESVTVAADTPLINMNSATTQMNIPMNAADNVRRGSEQRPQAQAAEPSVNVQNLQRRAAGVLPVRIDVPRAGSSHRFVKPLVIDEETVVGFRYRRR